MISQMHAFIRGTQAQITAYRNMLQNMWGGIRCTIFNIYTMMYGRTHICVVAAHHKMLV